MFDSVESPRSLRNSNPNSSTHHHYQPVESHLTSKKQQGIKEGVYRICTQSFDDDLDRYDKLYLSIESGFVKVFPEPRDDASLWKITRIYDPIDTFNINSPSTNLLHPNSPPKYRIENVGNREFLGLSRSRLTLVATKGFDSPLEVFISPPSKVDSGTTTQHKMYTILPDEAWGKPEEFYLHVGIWQLTPEGKPIVPAPVHLASRVFPESDCAWGLEFVEGL